MPEDLESPIPPARHYGQSYGPFRMDVEPGFDLGGAHIGHLPEHRDRKPFAFALRHGIGGAAIWFGQLLTTVCLIYFERKTVAGEKINVLVEQAPIPGIMSGTSDGSTSTPYAPDNLEEDHHLVTHLGWWGDVYLYWEANEDGEITLCDLRGPDVPEAEDISLLPESLVRADPTGQYFVKIGTVPEDDRVDQLISSDVTWAVTICKGQEESSSSSASSEESSPPSSGESSPAASEPSESAKDSAIVRDPASPTGFTRWYTYEEPEVRFGDLVVSTSRVDLARRVCRVPIDPRVVSMCERNFEVDGWSADTPCPLGFRVEKDSVVVTSPRRPVAALFGGRPQRVVFHVTATRKGFAGRRLEPATIAEFVANEDRLMLRGTKEQVAEFLRKHPQFRVAEK